MRATLLLIALTVAVVDLVTSTHPAYISCSKPDDEGTIVVFNNATWLQCRNGNLVGEYCIIHANDSHFECVDNARVVGKMEQYMSSPAAEVVINYFTDSSRKFADCDKLRREMKQYKLFKNLTDCTNGIEKKAPSPGESLQNPLCALKRRVHYLDDDGWYSCKNGLFELQKCIIKTNNDTEYHCVDKRKVENALRASERLNEFLESGSVCTNFSQHAETILRNYETELEACDEESVVSSMPVTLAPVAHHKIPTLQERVFETLSVASAASTTTEQSPVVAHLSYISCSKPSDEGTIVIYKNATWQTCRNGSLEIQHCINQVNGSSYECVKHSSIVTKMRGYMKSPGMARVVGKYFTDKSQTYTDCYKLKKGMPIVLSKFKFPDKHDCTDSLEKLDQISEENDLCSLKNRVYYLDDDSWYTCENGVFEMKKCVLKTADSKFYCISKQKIRVALQKSGQLEEFLERQNGSLCANFNETVETIFDNYAEELEACDTEIDGDNGLETESASTEISTSTDTSADLSRTADEIKVPTLQERVVETLSGASEASTNTEQSPVIAHPSYISCSKPSDEGNIVIYKNATWQTCRNGSLEIQHCINQVNGSSYECVKHSSVVTKMRGYMKNPGMARVVGKYFTDKSQTYTDCYKLKKGMPIVLSKFKFPDKHDCTDDLEKLDQISEENDLCSLKNSVYYLDDDSWYTCENGVFEMKKCVIKTKDSKYFCISKQKIRYALEKSGQLEEFLERQNGSLCANFNETVETIFDNYEEELEACDAEVDHDIVSQTESASTEVSTATDTSTDLSGTAEDIKDVRRYLGGHKMISEIEKCTEPGKNVNDIWYQCRMPTKCVVEYGKCLSFRDIELIFRDYHKAKRFGPNGAWDDDRFNEIRSSLNDKRAEIYDGLESSKAGDDGLFGSLARLVDHKPRYEKIVTIRVKNEKTRVAPHSACRIATDLAPFNRKYIDRRMKSC